MNFTAIIEKSTDGWYVGQIEEVPAAISQGATIGELKDNLKDALELIFEANREEIHTNYANRTVLKEVIRIAG